MHHPDLACALEEDIKTLIALLLPVSTSKGSAPECHSVITDYCLYVARTAACKRSADKYADVCVHAHVSTCLLSMLHEHKPKYGSHTITQCFKSSKALTLRNTGLYAVENAVVKFQIIL